MNCANIYQESLDRFVRAMRSNFSVLRKMRFPALVSFALPTNKHLLSLDLKKRG